MRKSSGRSPYETPKEICFPFELFPIHPKSVRKISRRFVNIQAIGKEFGEKGNFFLFPRVFDKILFLKVNEIQLFFYPDQLGLFLHACIK